MVDGRRCRCYRGLKVEGMGVSKYNDVISSTKAERNCITTSSSDVKIDREFVSIVMRWEVYQDLSHRIFNNFLLTVGI